MHGPWRVRQRAAAPSLAPFPRHGHGHACALCAQAMKYYSVAISATPKEAALYSNRSFAFLKLGLPERALADAEEVIKRRPDWAKGHFRRAEALRHAGLHDEARSSYARGSALDPQDDHLRAQCAASIDRARWQRRRNAMQALAPCSESQPLPPTSL